MRALTMPGKRIVVIQGHPDSRTAHYCHALAEAYAAGAAAGGHEVRHLSVAGIALPPLTSRAEWESETVSEPVREAQETLAWADHLVIVYPLWLGGMPAIVKGFFEQVLRPGFAIARSGAPTGWKKKLGGKSARVVVTMGMPALIYRWYFGAHSLKSLERNILKFCGIGPVRETLIGRIEAGGPRRHEAFLRKLRALGVKGR